MKKIVVIIFIIELIIPIFIAFAFWMDKDVFILPGYSHRIIYYQSLGRDSMEFYEYPYSREDKEKFIQNEYYKVMTADDVEIVKEYIKHFPYAENIIDLNEITEGNLYYLKTKHTEDEEKYDHFTLYFFDMNLSDLFYFNYVV